MIKSLNNFRRIDVKNNCKNSSDNYLLRGGPLDQLSKNDELKLLDKYNLSTVVDFRSKEERDSAPNKVIDGVDYYNIVALDPKKSVSKNPMEFLKAYKKSHDLSFMESLYSEFVFNDFSKKSFNEFLNVVAKADGSVYFHCTAGKDRTGYAAMLLLEILGVSQKEIFRDYLKTNDFDQDEYDLILSDLKTYYDNSVDTEHLKDLIGVRKDYLETSIKLIERDYGSVTNFIEDGLDVNSKTLKLIKNKFSV